MNEATQKLMFSSETDDWATPQALFDVLSARYGPFELDVCASDTNAKCTYYYTPTEDGLSRGWHYANVPTRYEFTNVTPGSERQLFRAVWMNPPYGRHNGGIGAWVKKAYEESQEGCLVCCLLPARTDTAWFHDYCLPHGKLQFLRGRVKFGSAKAGAPFPSMVVVFYPPKEAKL